jgi:hypothetical protein
VVPLDHLADQPDREQLDADDDEAPRAATAGASILAGSAARQVGADDRPTAMNNTPMPPKRRAGGIGR